MENKENGDIFSVWLIDDHQLFRAGFRTLLSRLPEVKVTFEGSDGAEMLDRLDSEKPDLIFLDIAMQNLDGIKASQIALSKYPELTIVIVSMFGEREYYTKLVEIGVRGFLLKSCDFEEVEQAISMIKMGEMYFSRELMDQIAERPNGKREMVSDELSDREKEVLTQICGGLSNQEIAEKLYLSKRTVEKHRASLMVKTGCTNTASLVVFAVKNGLYEV